MTTYRFGALVFIFSGLLLFLQYHLWFESDGIRDMVELKKKLAAKSVQMEALKKRNDSLLFQVDRLQHSQDAIESRARNELGMIKKNETFYQVINQ